MNQIQPAPESGSLVPPHWRLLDGSALKLLAVITMLVDHTASVLLRNTDTVLLRLGGHALSLYTAMRLIGRISFPLFAFLLVEGFLHTRSVRRYAGGLLLLAILTEIPWNLEHTGTLRFGGQNVLFTLLFGLLALWVIRDFRGSRASRALLLFGLLALTFVFRADYGCEGFAFILVLYLLREQKLCRAVLGCCVLPSQWIAGLAFMPISLYNGRRGFIRGRALKYAFYLVYPLHLLVLYWIRAATIGY